MVSLDKKRIERIFREAMERVESGRKPNIFQLMKKYGYSEKQAKKNAVTQTKTWKQLLDQINDESLLERLKKISLKGSDRESINAIKELLRLKDRYPKETTEVESGEVRVLIKK